MLEQQDLEINISDSEYYQLAQNYEKGINGLLKDELKAYKIYQELAERCYPPAQYYLGALYLNNVFSPLFDQNYDTKSYLPIIIESLREAYYLENDYDAGIVLEKIFKCNLYNAIKLFNLAAENCNVDAQFALGEIYISDVFGVKDIDKAKKFLIAAMDQGHVLAKCILGEIYYTIDKNKELAIQYYKEAAEQNCAAAIYNLAIRYDLGTDLELNPDLAVKMLMQAANLGHSVAKYIMSCKYSEGIGVNKNINKSVELSLQAAERGCAKSQNFLGMRYMEGEGVSYDYNKAVKFYKTAAIHSCTNALFNLGIIYLKDCKLGLHRIIQLRLQALLIENPDNNSIQVKNKLDKAMQFFFKAATDGYLPGKHALACLYRLLHDGMSEIIIEFESKQSRNLNEQSTYYNDCLSHYNWLKNFYAAKQNEFNLNIYEQNNLIKKQYRKEQIYGYTIFKEMMLSEYNREALANNRNQKRLKMRS